MPDLDQVVDLGAVADLGGADGGAVDGGVGLDIDAAAQIDGAGLRNLLPVSLLVLGEAEAVGADNCAVFKRYVIAEDAVFTDDGVGVGKEMIADLDAGVEDYVGQEGGVFSDADVGANDDVGADVRALADAGAGINDGGPVDAGGVYGRLVEEGQGAGEGEIGIRDAEGCGGDFLKFWINQDRCGVGFAGEGGVAGVGDEGHLRGAGLFNALDAGDFQLRVSAEFGAQPGCQLA